MMNIATIWLVTLAAASTDGLYGYCTTKLGGERVCSPVQAIDPRDHLLEKCSPWARSLGGKGWGFANGRSRQSLEEGQKSRCQRYEEIDRGEPHACRLRFSCEGSEGTRELGVTVKALSRDEAISKCVNLGADGYLDALKKAAREGCLVAPAL